MSGRQERVKEALSSTLAKLREDIESIMKQGRVPAQYSLGFTNALIFVDHQLNFRSGMPRFYDGEKTVGSLPKPVPLKTKEEQEQEAEFNDLLLQLREYARVVREKVQVSEVNQAYEVDTEAFAALALLFQSVANADEYVNKLVAAESPEPQIKAESHEEVRR